jgi:hypothetical protein
MLGVIRFQEGQHTQAIELIAGALKLNPPRRKPGSLGYVQGAAPIVPTGR